MKILAVAMPFEAARQNLFSAIPENKPEERLREVEAFKKALVLDSLGHAKRWNKRIEIP